MFTRLLAGIRKFANQPCIEIVEVFRDEGVSGTKEPKNRQSPSELLKSPHPNPST